MCERCATILRGQLAPGKQFQTNDRRYVTIDRVEGDEVHLKDHKPSPAFHVSHAAALLHWLYGDHYICGIGSGTTAIKTLVSKGGKLKLACSRCAGQANVLWAVLAAAPGVRRDQVSGLAPDPSSRPR